MLYGLYNAFLIDFDKKMFINIMTVIVKKIFRLKPSKREVVTLLKL